MAPDIYEEYGDYLDKPEARDVLGDDEQREYAAQRRARYLRGRAYPPPRVIVPAEPEADQ